MQEKPKFCAPAGLRTYTSENLWPLRGRIPTTQAWLRAGVEGLVHYVTDDALCEELDIEGVFHGL